MTAKYIHQTDARARDCLTVSAQTFDRNGDRAVLVRARCGVFISAGFDLTPENARALAAILVEMAEELQTEAA